MNAPFTYLPQVERFATHLLENHLPKGLVYHNYDHTLDVVQATHEIGTAHALNAFDLEAILMAAWLHDLGHSLTYENHEAASHHLAMAFLKAIECPDEQIQIVMGCIAATRMPQRPQNLLQAIICDADLSHMARPNFFTRNALLRAEWRHLLDLTYSQDSWNRNTLQFLEEHHYFTPYAQAHWQAAKDRHLALLRESVAKVEAA